MATRLSALPTDRLLHPGRFLVRISVRGRIDPRTIGQLEGLCQFEKSNVLIGNPTRDVLACSIVSQPTTLSGAILACIWVCYAVTSQVHVYAIYFTCSDKLLMHTETCRGCIRNWPLIKERKIYMLMMNACFVLSSINFTTFYSWKS
jgi:hypothetical protein